MSGLQRVGVLHGNPVDGFRLVGPYDSREEAIEDGDSVDTEWWVIDMEPPDGADAEEEAVKVASKVAAPKHEPEF
jgi:hypothetical protein